MNYERIDRANYTITIRNGADGATVYLQTGGRSGKEARVVDSANVAGRASAIGWADCRAAELRIA